MRPKHTLTFVWCSSLALFLLSLLSSRAPGAQTAGVVVHDAWVRVPAPSKMDTALYMVIENHTPQQRAVVSASSEAAAKLEMHQMKTTKPRAASGDIGGMGANQSSDNMNKNESNTNQSSMQMSMSKPADQSMMVMTPIKEIELPGNGKAMLAPNGLHLMMFGLKARPAPGDKIHVTLKLDDGTTVPVVATVRE